jgi:hypothetical protein
MERMYLVCKQQTKPLLVARGAYDSVSDVTAFLSHAVTVLIVGFAPVSASRKNFCRVMFGMLTDIAGLETTDALCKSLIRDSNY